MSHSKRRHKSTPGLDPHRPDASYQANVRFGTSIWEHYRNIRSSGRNSKGVPEPSLEVLAKVGRAWVTRGYSAKAIATTLTDTKNGVWGIEFSHLSSEATINKLTHIMEDVQRLQKSVNPGNPIPEDATIIPLEWNQAVDYVLGLVRITTGSTNCLSPGGLGVLGSYIGNPDPVVCCLYSHYNPDVVLTHGLDALKRLLDRPQLARYLMDVLHLDLRPIYAIKPPPEP